MKRTIVIVFAVVSTFHVSLFADTGLRCCAIAQASSVATAQTKVATLHIEGMSCASCATAVKHVLSKVAGVKEVSVSYGERKGVVTYDPARVTPQEIASAVEEKLPTYKATVIK